MARRIFRNMMAVALLAVLLTVALVVPALYNAHEESMSRELFQETESIALALELAEDDAAYLEKLRTDSRLTLIAPDGGILFDSVADASQMENHMERPEVAQALETGAGESVRISDTLSETTIYCAVRLEDGRVLRIAGTRRSMLGTFVNVLPMIAAMLLGVALLSVLAARRAARMIVAPINGLDLERPLENNAYDELAPLLTRMHRQHEQIARQVRALETAHAELTAIMANMREGMILLDKSSTVLSMNESAARIFDVSAEKSTGQSLLNVNRDADLHDEVRRALDGEGGCLPMERDGRQYEAYVSPVMKENAVHGVVMLVLDVTERYAAEKSRREFTANVSHELKTPLTSISGFAEIIRDGIAQPQDIQRFAGMICREATRLVALVNDILELSKLDERRNPGVWQPVALRPLMRELADDFAAAAQKKGQSVCVSGDDGSGDDGAGDDGSGDDAVCGDASLLREMFFNLLDNAIKYTPEGGRIAVAIRTEDGRIVCSVSDNGVGIPPEHQPHVFERFYRVDKSHSRQTGGTGLGLAIVKHIAQIHKAEIRLHSVPGEGTEIQVIFNGNEK